MAVEDHVSMLKTRPKMLDIIILTLFTIFVCGYLWLKQQYLFWENRRVPYLKPDSLIFGNAYDVVTGRVSVSENVLKHYNGLAPHKFGGVYNFYKPLLYIRDPELIKHVLIKDFHHFYDRSFVFAHKKDPLSLHLFNLVGEDWKILRHKLSPTFTSGKMKMLFVLMKDCVEKLSKIVEKNAFDHETVDVKDLMARYTTDVISSCAFGLEVDSLHNPDSEFRIRGKEVFAPTPRQRLRELLFALSPGFVRFLGFNFLPDRTTNFFLNLVKDTIEYRNENGIVRNDFLNLLMNIQKEEPTEETKHFDFSMNLLAAQCFVFFLAGFETSSNALTFILYELSEHQDVQKKLQEEIDRVLEKHDGQITYDGLQEMHYMDQVFNETERLFPAVPILLRICTENYCIPDSDYVIKRGETLFIPIYALHRDPQYYPNPEVFNPENFSEEAKATRPTSCFLPFGDGPRNCIGLRFGVMQVKLALTMILRKHTVTLSPKMKLPIELMPFTILTASKNDILLNFDKRNDF